MWEASPTPEVQLMSYYPPGVTGNEYAIAGPDWEREHDEPCPKCGGLMYAVGYQQGAWATCQECKFQLGLDVPIKGDNL